MNNIDEINNPVFFYPTDEMPVIKFKTGDRLTIDLINDEIKLISIDEILQLRIKIEKNGLSVNINASQLNIIGTDKLTLSSKKINLEASEQIDIKSGGNLIQQIGKDCLTQIGGSNKSSAQMQKLSATLGSVEIKANDDVRLDGERIKLNCD